MTARCYIGLVRAHESENTYPSGFVPLAVGPLERHD